MQIKATIRTACLGIVWIGVCATIFIGCSNRQQFEQANSESMALGISSLQETDVDVQNGAQLWADNCIRCHNYRAPASLNDRQWEIVMHHMRVRANLTANEHRLILQFLQSAN